MADKKNIYDMLDSMIANKPEQAEVNFHHFLQPKMQEVLGIVQPEASAEEEPDSDD